MTENKTHCFREVRSDIKTRKKKQELNFSKHWSDEEEKEFNMKVEQEVEAAKEVSCFLVSKLI